MDNTRRWSGDGSFERWIPILKVKILLLNIAIISGNVYSQLLIDFGGYWTRGCSASCQLVVYKRPIYGP